MFWNVVLPFSEKACYPTHILCVRLSFIGIVLSIEMEMYTKFNESVMFSRIQI